MKTKGFVLVGGQSSRMGQDKARLLFKSRFLVQDVLSKVIQITEDVALVGRPEAYVDLDVKCLADLRPGLGPLSGLETALASSRRSFHEGLNLVVGCDMPDLQPRWLEQLLVTAQSTGALCVAAKDAAGKTHPLCAVYRTACLASIQEGLDTRRLRLLELLAAVQAVEMPVDGVIVNVNTPEQWAIFLEKTLCQAT
ncbi:MAG TPA: molybdenum cofactor guanylyltransferase [Bryobacteraceae bacterium]|nr:molybdenum cofactor guanylyltransferase [Bryobacteraceae bacterium]